MSNFTIRIRKFLNNPLLARRQFVVDVIHPGIGGISKADLKEKLAKLYKVSDANCIVLFGFKTAFGGGHSSGFGLIYNNISALRKFEHKYRQIRMGILEKKTPTGRKGRKETKNRRKKVRGTAKAKVSGSKK
ncbi:40S ribosomal protein S24, putative [Cryptosporidium muris RN66]|uniref:40S ribosomal protein S24, putative n=1 Tax=Cryptosporidium muris (strain RN66) TaxID=441375 RepID=B6AE76_CRYMR|nr:40S ribosomal protein S24, putative [Cryptosporidium muris RN66]EEA06517.1 40S ribosomal protein S24, putative [Cryptosporidium muris RN66]|eukprot:XP_002140866.1 40S ribosomal protein S24 [Cryptosporidium muris RN66]